MPHKAFPPYGTVDAYDMTPVGRSGCVLYTLVEDRVLEVEETLVDQYHPLFDAWPFVQGTGVWCYVRCDPAVTVHISGALSADVKGTPDEQGHALKLGDPPPRQGELKVKLSKPAKLRFVLAVRFDLAP